MNDFPPAPQKERLSRLTVAEGRRRGAGKIYSGIIKSLRFILPLVALALTVIVVTWNEAGRRVAPLQKHEVLPASANIENELMKPVFNSVDSRNRPYTVTADRAVQSRSNPDIVELEKPVAELLMQDGTKMSGDADEGLYEQKSQKLNLEGSVHVRDGKGYILNSEELRVDIAAQKAYSGRDVFVEGPGGTIDAHGLEGDMETGRLIFTGPAKVILYSDGNPLSPKANTP